MVMMMVVVLVMALMVPLTVTLPMAYAWQARLLLHLLLGRLDCRGLCKRISVAAGQAQPLQGAGGRQHGSTGAGLLLLCLALLLPRSVLIIFAGHEVVRKRNLLGLQQISEIGVGYEVTGGTVSRHNVLEQLLLVI